MTEFVQSAKTSSFRLAEGSVVCALVALLSGCGGAGDTGDYSTEHGTEQQSTEIVEGPNGKLVVQLVPPVSDKSGTAQAGAAEHVNAPELAPPPPGIDAVDVEDDTTVAYSCNNGDSVSIGDGYASASVWLGYNCSDGRAHIDGTVYDVARDQRSAWVTMRYYHDGHSGWPYRTDDIANGGGYGSNLSFSRNTGDNTPSIIVYVYASSAAGFNQTRGASDWLH